MNGVVCESLIKTFDVGGQTVHALQKVDLSIPPSKLMLLVGPSGSGKTTLLSIISGILSPTSGRCLLDGEDINALSNGEKTAFRGKNIGFVFQSYQLIPTLTATENAAVPLLLAGIARLEAEKRAAALLSQLGLEEKLSSFPRELSGGQQQRVAIARGMIHNPRLIVCDEPTSALDLETGQKVMELLYSLKENRVIIVVTHDERIFRFGDAIARMEDGKIEGWIKTFG